jgi:hypothetical protein
LSRPAKASLAPKLLEAVELALKGDWQSAHHIAQDHEGDEIANYQARGDPTGGRGRAPLQRQPAAARPAGGRPHRQDGRGRRRLLHRQRRGPHPRPGRRPALPRLQRSERGPAPRPAAAPPAARAQPDRRAHARPGYRRQHGAVRRRLRGPPPAPALARGRPPGPSLRGAPGGAGAHCPSRCS